jgi:hypothetical protein
LTNHTHTGPHHAGTTHAASSYVVILRILFLSARLYISQRKFPHAKKNREFDDTNWIYDTS